MDLERNRAVDADRQACTVSLSLVRARNLFRPCRPVRRHSSLGHCRLEGEEPPVPAGPRSTLVPASRHPQSPRVRLLARETMPCAVCVSLCHRRPTRAFRRSLPWRPVRSRILRLCDRTRRPCTPKEARHRASRLTLQALLPCLDRTGRRLLRHRRTGARLLITFASIRVCTSWSRRSGLWRPSLGQWPQFRQRWVPFFARRTLSRRSLRVARTPRTAARSLRAGLLAHRSMCLTMSGRATVSERGL